MRPTILITMVLLNACASSSPSATAPPSSQCEVPRGGLHCAPPDQPRTFMRQEQPGHQLP